MTPELCASRFGPIVNGQWPDAAIWCGLVKLPKPIQDKVINTLTGKPWLRVYCNLVMQEPLLIALQAVIDKGLLYELETFDGCLSVRSIRGHPDQDSSHSWALALDLNAKKNPLGGESSFSPEFVSCFTDQGFTWGGNFHRKDPQHFSFAGF